MGNFSSQYLDEWAAVKKHEVSVSKEKAELTPKNKNIRCLPADPRSPTSAIRRTPIQVEKTPQKKNSPYIALDNSDENKLDFDGCEQGEEACEATTLQETNNVEVKTTGNGRPAKQRSPLKSISKKKTDSPVMYLRYKQIKEIRDGYAREFHNKTVEMNDVSHEN